MKTRLLNFILIANIILYGIVITLGRNIALNSTGEYLSNVVTPICLYVGTTLEFWFVQGRRSNKEFLLGMLSSMLFILYLMFTLIVYGYKYTSLCTPQVVTAFDILIAISCILFVMSRNERRNQSRS